MKRIGALLMLLFGIMLNTMHSQTVVILGPEPDKVTYSFSVVDSITRRYIDRPDVLGFVKGDSVVASKGERYTKLVDMLRVPVQTIKFPALDSCEYNELI